ncbi:nucleotide-binding domain-containing protein [Cadophora sp. DSE1049]|nr:nucleotide-binding domain-containing protein [Cadophora sp. DSE1049]
MKSLTFVFAFSCTFLVAISQPDPGFPVANPTTSYWQIPPHPDVADHQSNQIPTDVDVVIIGSGMTGTSVARHLLKIGSQTNPLKIAMFDARQACSGATGRNGGHIRPSSYSEYDDDKKAVGMAEAAKIVRLRVAHVDALISAANELDDAGREASEARSVDSIDAFFDDAGYAGAVQQMQVLKAEVPEVGAEWTAWPKDDARKASKIQPAPQNSRQEEDSNYLQTLLLPTTSGAFTGSPKIAGAIWPYRFITHTLKALLDAYPSFSLDTNTAVTNVSTISDSSTSQVYDVTTARGIVRTRHVVHAANAWIPHLVPGLRGKIHGNVLTMSAQLGGQGTPKAGEWPPYLANGSAPGGRAWSLYNGGLDYVVQMPRNGELMFGGGGGGPDNGAPGTSGDSSLSTRVDPPLGIYDDSTPADHVTASYLNGALPDYFGYDAWGAERSDFPPSKDTNVWPGRTMRVWTGIEGGATDGRPYVGRIPVSATQRQVKNQTGSGEWISAAYDGEGMCFAWLCGRALSSMILGNEFRENTNATTIPAWFPQSFTISDDRLIKSNSTAVNRMVRRRITRMGN